MLFVAAVACAAPAAASDARSVFELSLEELVKLKVTSVSRRAEYISQAAAAIYTITAEDIRRSAATTLAEALRLAPNLLVARLDAGAYAISARGFNSNVANKLLVLVDGRTVYSPLFSGVFWDAQEVLLEDIERIEVISGPGASLWGTNAVNGVINVITRSSRETQGVLAVVRAGPRVQTGTLRYGGPLGENGSFRIYARGWDTDRFTALAAPGAADGWKRKLAGFRTDFGIGANEITVQAEAYDGASDARRQAQAGRVDVSGFHLLGRWSRKGTAGDELQVQAYFDRSTHRDALLLDESEDRLDVELKHLLAPIGAHTLQWGAGLRRSQDRSSRGSLIAFIPEERHLSWINLFVQDQIRLAPSLELTLGARFERNDYTGWELLPSARVGWTISESHFAWSALSRAVRAPSRLDRELFTPPRPPFLLGGGPDFDSEVAKVLEVGYRGRPHPAFSYSVTGFYQKYDRLRSAELAPVTVFPVTLQNKAEGSVKGLEAWAYWQLTPNWRMAGGLTLLDADLRLKRGSTDSAGPANLGNNPNHQWILRSMLSLGPAHSLDVTLRRVGSLPPFPANASVVPAYTSLDLRYAWQVDRHLELSLVAQNALDRYHREWGSRTTSAEIARSVFLQAVWRQ